ncbi:MAG: hypothetical protein L6R42_008260 [Xanthoria sp. 1 TBL-2021]|nr:MAG: hypothetical protein L6R42_008260 [Xanthoria sp. 1 TBL-2021]
MVSFWPWKADDSSPASFEKALSTLSTRINRTNTKLDSLRQGSRRFGALWTLYTSFAYLLCSVVLVLVVGWREWGVVEYAGLVGGPVVIYLVRTAIQAFYNYRIAIYQAQSDALQKQRDTTIEKLKAATKYNSTQELLKKYGGTPPSKDQPPGGSSQKNTPSKMSSPGSGQARTGFIPPPTANIPGRNQPISLPSTPQQANPRAQDRNIQRGPFSAAAAIAPWQNASSALEPSADFAPNAFSSNPQYAQPGNGSKWYDRLMDLVLGEDETLPRNRLALICHQCRLVNGQAPPGVQTLEAVGKWRCSGCNTMNGVENEGAKILKEIKKQAVTPETHNEVIEESNAAAGSHSVEEDAGEASDNAQSDEPRQDTPSSGSEKEEPRGGGGEMTGAQKKIDTTRRRSSRVKKKTKG